MATAKVPCPGCKVVLAVPADNKPGIRVRCPKCQTTFAAATASGPTPNAAPPAPAPAPAPAPVPLPPLPGEDNDFYKRLATADDPIAAAKQPKKTAPTPAPGEADNPLSLDDDPPAKPAKANKAARPADKSGKSGGEIVGQPKTRRVRRDWDDDDDDPRKITNTPLIVMLGGAGVLAFAGIVVSALALAGVFDRKPDTDTAAAAPQAVDNPQPPARPAPEPKPEPKPNTAPSTTPQPNPPFTNPAPQPPVRVPDPQPQPQFELPPRPGADRPGGPPPFGPPNGPPPIGPAVNAPQPAAPPAAPRGKAIFPPPKPVEIKAAPLAQDTVEVKLPGKIAEFAIGGGGRYWCLLLAETKQIAIFDTNEAKVAKYLPLASELAYLTAGMNKLFVAYPDTGALIRYDLETFEKEITIKLPFDGTCKGLGMGSASSGPLLVCHSNPGLGGGEPGTIVFLHPITLQELDAGPDAAKVLHVRTLLRTEFHCRARSDGRAFVGWNGLGRGYGGEGLFSCTLSEAGAKVSHGAGGFKGIHGPASIADDGTILAFSGMYRPDFQPIGKKEPEEPFGGFQRCPAQQGPLYLALSTTITDKQRQGFKLKTAMKLSVHLPGVERPLVTIPEFRSVEVMPPNDPTADALASALPSNKPSIFCPQAKLIGAVSAPDTLTLYKFDLDAILEKSEVDYLFATSRSPAAEPGKPFRYPIAVKSKKGGVNFQLIAGPNGMKVDTAGTITWNVPNGWAGSENVIVRVSDKSGQETFHTFALIPPAPAAGAVAGGGAGGANPQPAAPGGGLVAANPQPAAPAPAKAIFPTPKPVELKTAPLAQDTVEVKLPGRVGDAVIGGGGRYWCLLLPDAKQVAIFDVNQAKVTRYLPLASSTACLAAGMNKLVIAYPDTELLVRYDLETFEKEVTAKLPFQGTVKQICMGSASAGPLLVFYGKGTGALDQAPVAFLNLTTFTELDIGARNGVGGGRALMASFRDTMHYRASPDGRVYGAWATSHTPTGLNGVVLSETGVKTYYEHDTAGNVVPAADGHLLTGNGVFTPELKVIGQKGWTGSGLRIPAQQGDWYLAFAPAQANPTGFPDRNQATRMKATLFRTTDTRPLLALGELDLTLGSDAWTASDFTQDKRIFFSPAGGLLAWVAPTNDKLHLHAFNLDAALDKAGIDYLLVTSRPPAAEPGKPFKYTLAVKSKKGGPRFKLDAGPEGMAIAPDGTLTWTVPKDWSGSESVIITVSDKSGQEVFHTFTLNPAAPSAPGGAAVVANPVQPEPGPRPSPKLPRIPNAARPQPAPAPADAARQGIIRPAENPAKLTVTRIADKAEIRLPGAADATCLGGNGRYVLFRIPKVKQVAVVDVCEGKVAKYLPLPEEGAFLAAGNSHLFILAPTANVIQRWNLTTFQKEATVANPLAGPPRHLLIGHATDGPLFVVGPNKALDGKTFKEVPFGEGGNGHRMGDMAGHPQYPPSIRISADGRVMAWWSQGISPSGLSSLVIGESGVKTYYEHTTVGAIIPGPDGTLFTGGGLFTPELKAIGAKKGYQYWHHAPIPAAHGRFYLSLPADNLPGGAAASTKVELKIIGDEKPLADLSHLDGFDVPKGHNQTAARGLQLHDRTFLVPDAKALVLLNGTADKVIIHRLDVETLMDKAGIDYLFVTSRPPAAVRGTAYRYKPEVKSRKGGVTIKLDAGPEGMKVAADGTVTWEVPADFGEGSVNVILTVSDKSGQETFHTFTLPVANKP